jgi:fibronectin type 3 domain-containing protein
MLVGPMGVDQNLIQKTKRSLQKRLTNSNWRFIVTIIVKKDIGKGNIKRKKKDEKSSNETNVMECSIFITNIDQSFSRTLLLMMKSMKWD